MSHPLRVTDSGRPFAREFHDLFSTLMASLDLRTNHARFTKFDHSFALDAALGNLSTLKFLQSTRSPCLRDPSRIVTATTTTTFHMSKDAAHSIFQRFVDARLIVAVPSWPGPFPSRPALYQVTPKGISVLLQFCQRRGIRVPHLANLVASARSSAINKLLILERDLSSDALLIDRATIEVIFRHFAGQSRPNIAAPSSPSLPFSLSLHSSSSSSSSGSSNGSSSSSNGSSSSSGGGGSSSSNSSSGGGGGGNTTATDAIVGVPMMLNEKIGKKIFHYTFSGQAAIDWLLTSCTTVDDREAYEIFNQFVANNLIGLAQDSLSSSPAASFSSSSPYSAAAAAKLSRSAVYALTAEGEALCNWKRSDSSSSSISISISNSSNNNSGDRSPTQSFFDFQASGLQDSNKLRLRCILNDPSLRLLFREFLTTTFCEENLLFYLELSEFIDAYGQQQGAGAFDEPENIRRTLSDAYGFYNTFLASGSPCELNLEYGLRRSLTIQMVSSMMDPNPSRKGLQDTLDLLKMVQKSIFQLMSSDSVPKFFTDARYAAILQQHDWEKS